MIGKLISHYRILGELGQGGMGVVYKAKDTKLKRTVALKFLTPLAVGHEKEKTRFLYKAQAAAALNHPNICTIHEIDEYEGQSVIVMEFVEGRSLKELTIDNCLSYAIQIAEGLQVAHQEGIIHHDIKSANIMVTTESWAKITDFGLAKLVLGSNFCLILDFLFFILKPALRRATATSSTHHWFTKGRHRQHSMKGGHL